jgi:hypothetical protein
LLFRISFSTINLDYGFFISMIVFISLIDSYWSLRYLTYLPVKDHWLLYQL